MKTDFETVLLDLNNRGCKYCVINVSDSVMELLVEDDFYFCIDDILNRKEWKHEKNNDQYLYGLQPREKYRKKNDCIVFNYKLACRSTLNDAWVPLDRCVNDRALQNGIYDEKRGLNVLAKDDEICYLLAFSVYTEKCFSENNKAILNDNIATLGDKAKMLEYKLSKVFFRFSDKILELAMKNEYDDIIPSLYSFCEY